MASGTPFYGITQDELTAALRELTVGERWRVFIVIVRRYDWLLETRGKKEKRRLLELAARRAARALTRRTE